MSRYQKFIYLRHAVQLLVLLLVVCMPVWSFYFLLKHQGKIEQVRVSGHDSLQKNIIMKIDDLYSGAELAANPVAGNTWSAEVFSLSLTDPLGGIESIVSGKQFSWTILSALLIPLALTIVFGRFFCSWVCPAGLLFEIGDSIRGFLSKLSYPLKNYSLWRYHKYVLLFIGLCMSALVSLPLLSYIYPPALLVRDVHAVVDSYFSILPGDPLQAAAVVVSFVPLIFLIIITSEIFISRRAWCRSICPGGALYSLFGARRSLRVVNENAKCTQCAKCIQVCPMGLNPMIADPGMECDQCLRCLCHCEGDSLSLRFFVKRGEKASIEKS